MDLKTINRAYKHARTGDTYDVMISDAEEHIKRCCNGYDRYSQFWNRFLDQLRKEKEEELQLVDQVVAWANEQPEPIRGIVLDRVQRCWTWGRIAEERGYVCSWSVITLRKYCEAESRAERGA